VEQHDRRKAQVAAPDDPRTDAPAIRDASAILARARADELAADAARGARRLQPIPSLRPDDRIGPRLRAGERVVAVRHSAQLDRRQPEQGAKAPSGIAGDLYLTSQRLVLVGRVYLEVDLRDIEEAGVSGERLLLVLNDGRGISLDVEGPRLLRVEIAAARALARAGPQAGGPPGQPSSR
jgi:hypothetical protein